MTFLGGFFPSRVEGSICNLLQLAATAAICCNWLQVGPIWCGWFDEIWADTQVSPTMYDWVQFAATGCK